MQTDPAVESVIGFTGGGRQRTTTARMFITLKPLEERKVVRGPGHRAAARQSSRKCPAPACSCKPYAGHTLGGRASRPQYQYTLQGDNLDELERMGARVCSADCATSPSLADVNTDQQDKGLQTR